MFLGHFAAGLLASRVWILVSSLALVYLANVFGPPPPSVTAIAISMIVAVPLVWWWGNKVAESDL